jgi:hypothetical protein
MNDNLQLDDAKVAPSMPTAYVDFVRRLWRKQEKESRYTWGRKMVMARRPVFLRLLASDELSAVFRHVYEKPVGPKIAEALTRNAVQIPQLWMGEDKWNKEEKVAQVKRLRSAINNVVALLGKDRSAPPPWLVFENVFSKPVRWDFS